MQVYARHNMDLNSQHHCLSNNISIFFRFLIYPQTLLPWEADATGGLGIVIVLLSGGWRKHSLYWICAGGGGGKHSVEWISYRCFSYGYSYSLYSRVQVYRWDSMKKIEEKIPIPIPHPRRCEL